MSFTSLQIHPNGSGFDFTWPDRQACEKTYQLEWARDIAGPCSAVEASAELVGGRWLVTLDNPNSFQRYFCLRLLEQERD